MSARIPAGYAELWIQYNTVSDPENMYTAIGVELAGGQTATQTATDTLLNIAVSAIDNMLSNDYTVGPGHMVWGNDGGDIRIDGSNTPNTGLIATGTLPQNCGVLVRKLTAAGGRRNRGRMYIPGIPEGNVNAIGNLTSAYKTTCQTAVNDLQSNLVANAAIETLVLFHETAPFTPTEITELVVQTKIATQRRRMRP